MYIQWLLLLSSSTISTEVIIRHKPDHHHDLFNC